MITHRRSGGRWMMSWIPRHSSEILNRRSLSAKETSEKSAFIPKTSVHFTTFVLPRPVDIEHVWNTITSVFFWSLLDIRLRRGTTPRRILFSDWGMFYLRLLTAEVNDEKRMRKTGYNSRKRCISSDCLRLVNFESQEMSSQPLEFRRSHDAAN